MFATVDFDKGDSPSFHYMGRASAGGGLKSPQRFGVNLNLCYDPVNEAMNKHLESILNDPREDRETDLKTAEETRLSNTPSTNARSTTCCGLTNL